ncbi:MAG: SWIM zinc finger family protein [Methanoregula sp.]|nr:SWIM zinc finger family protein [Methanoregula sp.]
MSYWGHYYPPANPIKVKDGIAARSKKGDIGETWWSKRFIGALEMIGIGSRLQRGKTYARKGQVINISFHDAVVHAQVQGTNPRPYSITISFIQFNDKQWDEIFDALSSQALFTAMLLGGEIPKEIETVFAGVKLSLLPSTHREIKTNCSCPDSANPCKHIAAVYYILAEQFDRDPFLIFALRGRDRNAVLEELRKRRSSVDEVVEKPDPAHPAVHEPKRSIGPRLPECLDSFWDAGETLDSFPIYLHIKPELEAAALKRLGPSRFKIGNKDLSDLLVPVYAKAREYVAKEIKRVGSEVHND